MNKLDIKARARILACLVEGNSIRATVRMPGAAKNTVVKLLCGCRRGLRASCKRDAAGDARQPPANPARVSVITIPPPRQSVRESAETRSAPILAAFGP